MESLYPDSTSAAKSAPIPVSSAASTEQPRRLAPDNSQVPGIVIDHSPASSGRYIGSPSIAILPNGDYVASHDFFGPAAGHTTSAESGVFSSTDRGGTWRKIADIAPLFWGKLFVHRDALYILGTRHEYGDVLIRRSGDGGKTWTEPSGSTSGVLRRGPYQFAPCQKLLTMAAFGARWSFSPAARRGNLAALVMSGPADSDLLNADRCNFSEPLPKQAGFSWLEGAVLLAPDGKVVNVLRTNGNGDNRAAIVHVSDDGRTLSYNPAEDFVNMPGGGVKFTIRHNQTTSRYWSIVSKQTNPEAYRNNFMLTSSVDLREWRVESPLLYHTDVERHAWQYTDWQFVGDDIIFVSRTAYDDGLGGASNAHDANYLTFHRITDFRKRLPGPL